MTVFENAKDQLSFLRGFVTLFQLYTVAVQKRYVLD